VSEWKKEASGIVKYRFIVPGGSLAIVDLGAGQLKDIEILKANDPSEALMPEGYESGRFELAGGDYQITIKKTRPGL
jgi:hypothetical protein